MICVLTKTDVASKLFYICCGAVNFVATVKSTAMSCINQHENSSHIISQIEFRCFIEGPIDWYGVVGCGCYRNGNAEFSGRN